MADDYKPGPSKAPAPTDFEFDGNPEDLDRALGMVVLQFTLHADAFDEDAKKVAYLISHFRGAALDWGVRLVARNDNRLQNYGQFVTSLKDHFGYDPQQLALMYRTRLGTLRQTGDLQEFLVEFEETCENAGVRTDVSKLALLPSKLNKSYYDALANSGSPVSSYSSLRMQLMNMYAMRQDSKALGDTKRKQSKCGKCGKRGHSAAQCRSTN